MSAFLALASSAVWGASDFLGGLLARRLPALLVVACSQAAALVVLGAVVLVRDTPTGWGGLGAGLASGVAGAGGLACFYTALARGTMGVVSPIAALSAVVAVLLGLATGERFGPVVATGMVVAVSGAVLAAGPDLGGAVGARPVLLAGAAAVLFGVSLFLLDRGADDGVLHALVAMRLGGQAVLWPLVAATALRARRGPGSVAPPLRSWPALVVLGLGDVSANGLFALASTTGSVGVTSVLGSLFPVATLLLARVVLHERMRPVQVAGVALALVGVVLTTRG